MSTQQMGERESDGGCPDCGHPLMEHGAFGCTHGYHEPPRDDLARGYEVCSCRRGRHDPLPEGS
jgi:hypothetical protein